MYIPYTAPISGVVPNSPAETAGIREGWELVSVNGKPIPDILAYRRELEKGLVTLVCRNSLLKTTTFSVQWEDPGLEFSEVIFDGIKLCVNKCEFCYVHQMPQGMRKSLYIMDDDFRTSFLYGSFVTLTNLTEADLERILDENLSPLYVSVHTTNQDLRADMMKWWKLKVKTPEATKIRTMLEKLRPIELYTQMVLLPGRNDGEYLDETLNYLASLPNVLAVACVPVGLTDHRENLPNLCPYNKVEAKNVLEQVHTFQVRMLAERGSRFVFASDEFYLLAGEPIPAEETYEGYQMLENGVGMVRDFLSAPLPPLPKELKQPKKVILATGKLFGHILEQAVAPMKAIKGLELEVQVLKNYTFGEVTTVTGLLAGGDILRQIKPREADTLLVSPNVLKYGTETLLDGKTLTNLRQELAMEVQAGGTNLKELAETIITGENKAYEPQFGFSTHAIKEASKQH